MELSTIAVACDLSAASADGALCAVALARRTGARVLLVHACDVVEHDPDAPGLRAWGESQFRDRRARLTELTERLSGQGAEVSQVVVDGKPAPAICEVARERRADLVVVTPHGAGGALGRFLLGSTSERVVRLADRAVLVARSPSAAFRKVLVAVDISEVNDRLIEVALALSGGGEVELFYSWHLPPGLVIESGGDEAELFSDLRERRAASAAERLHQLVLSHRAPGVDLYYAHAEAASPRDGVLARIEAGGYDLVVLGSHGRTGVSRLLGGSVAEGVARAAPCSVAVVKPLS